MYSHKLCSLDWARDSRFCNSRICPWQRGRVSYNNTHITALFHFNRFKYLKNSAKLGPRLDRWILNVLGSKINFVYYSVLVSWYAYVCSAALREKPRKLCLGTDAWNGTVPAFVSYGFFTHKGFFVFSFKYGNIKRIGFIFFSLTCAYPWAL